MMRVVDNEDKVEGDDEEESIMRTTNGDTHLAGNSTLVRPLMHVLLWCQYSYDVCGNHTLPF